MKRSPAEDLFDETGESDQGNETQDRQGRSHGQEAGKITRRTKGFRDVLSNRAGKDATHIGGEAEVASRAAGRNGEPFAQALEEFRAVSRARDGGESVADPEQRVGVAAADGGEAVLSPGPEREVVRGPGHHAVLRLDESDALEHAIEIVNLPRTGERRKGVIDAGGHSIFGEPCEERLGIAPAPRYLMVARLVEVPDSEVDLAAFAQVERHFFADDEVGEVSELERAFDRVVIGDGHKIHPPTLRRFVDRQRF